MKKTLTVNLGGTVYHIDEDAYGLLDQYLSSLRSCFKSQQDAGEIVNDIEGRISEIFSDLICNGQQVITISDVEAVIKQMGKPEDFMEQPADGTQGDSQEQTESKTEYKYQRVEKRLYRDPGNKVIGGVFAGFAAYTGWDVTLIRLIALVLMFFYGIIIPIYIICWIIIPQANTAAEILSMHGEEINMENIGKTVTDGFDKAAKGVNDFVKSGKPRSFLQRFCDDFVALMGIFLKILLIIIAIIFSPVLFVCIFMLIIFIIAALAMAFGGSAAILSIIPYSEWLPFTLVPSTFSIVASVGLLLTIIIPLVALVFVILRAIFNWEPMGKNLKWTLLIIWFAGIITTIVGLFVL